MLNILNVGHFDYAGPESVLPTAMDSPWRIEKHAIESRLCDGLSILWMVTREDSFVLLSYHKCK